MIIIIGTIIVIIIISTDQHNQCESIPRYPQGGRAPHLAILTPKGFGEDDFCKDSLKDHDDYMCDDDDVGFKVYVVDICVDDDDGFKDHDNDIDHIDDDSL